MIIKVLRLERRSGKSAMAKASGLEELFEPGKLLELREGRVVLLQPLLQGLERRLRVEELKKPSKSDADFVEVQVAALPVLQQMDELEERAQPVAPSGAEDRNVVALRLLDPRSKRRERFVVGRHQRPDRPDVERRVDADDLDGLLEVVVE